MEKSFFQKTKVQIAIGTLALTAINLLIANYASPDMQNTLNELAVYVVGTGLSLIGTHTVMDLVALLKNKK